MHPLLHHHLILIQHQQRQPTLLHNLQVNLLDSQLDSLLGNQLVSHQVNLVEDQLHCQVIHRPFIPPQYHLPSHRDSLADSLHGNQLVNQLVNQVANLHDNHHRDQPIIHRRIHRRIHLFCLLEYRPYIPHRNLADSLHVNQRVSPHDNLHGNQQVC